MGRLANTLTVPDYHLVNCDTVESNPNSCPVLLQRLIRRQRLSAMLRVVTVSTDQGARMQGDYDSNHADTDMWASAAQAGDDYARQILFKAVMNDALRVARIHARDEAMAQDARNRAALEFIRKWPKNAVNFYEFRKLFLIRVRARCKTAHQESARDKKLQETLRMVGSDADPHADPVFAMQSKEDHMRFWNLVEETFDSDLFDILYRKLELGQSTKEVLGSLGKPVTQKNIQSLDTKVSRARRKLADVLMRKRIDGES